jgi:hypothetical protein
MHRNHIPELKGTWMEEWHQKLHNNTTPDDVPICAAYIAFLESNGDEGRYWRVLSDHGITRQRLESFDRPIKTPPQFFGDKKVGLRLNTVVDKSNRGDAVEGFVYWTLPPHNTAHSCCCCALWFGMSSTPLYRPYALQDALIGEFRNYLGILKSVHSGADLQVGAAGAEGAGAQSHMVVRVTK